MSKDNFVNLIDEIENAIALAQRKAKQYVEKNTKYKWGGKEAEKGFDCSGLISSCFVNRLSSGSAAQLRQMKNAIAPFDAGEAGDLIFLIREDKTPYHVMLIEKRNLGTYDVIHAFRKNQTISRSTYEIDFLEYRDNKHYYKDSVVIKVKLFLFLESLLQI